jgi:NADH-quinone oxidoreductase subunit E
MVNWEFMDNQTPSSARQLVDDLRSGVEVTSTRGPRICTWREAERVLAGFPDDRADEGPSAGPASLVGVELARENGWTAPQTDEPDHRTDGNASRHADGKLATASTKTGAAEQADTSRAESETEADESSVDVKGDVKGDANGDTKDDIKGEK